MPGKNYCTLFLRKKNKPVITFWVNTDNEDLVKCICITKGYLGEEKAKKFTKLLEEEKQGEKEGEEMLAEFDKKFRLLISNK